MDTYAIGEKKLMRKVTPQQVQFASKFLSKTERDGTLHPESVSIVSRMGDRLKNCINNNASDISSKPNSPRYQTYVTEVNLDKE